MQFKRYLKYVARFLFGVVLGVLTFSITIVASSKKISNLQNSIETSKTISYIGSIYGEVAINLIFILLIVVYDVAKGNFFENKKYYKELNIFLGQIFVVIGHVLLALAIMSSL